MVYKPDQPHRTICLTLSMFAAVLLDSTLDIRKNWLTVSSLFHDLTAGNLCYTAENMNSGMQSKQPA